MKDLQADNPASTVTVSKGKAAMQIKDEVFEVSTSLALQSLSVHIPRIGTFRYIYDEENERWVGENDGHNLEELLTRELMRVSQGYLKL